MRRKTFIATIWILVLALSGVLVTIYWLLERALVGHQQSVTKAIAAWGEKYSQINNPNDAARATEMVEYIRGYYVVSEGYSSDPQTDAALENQRRETIERINMALQEYKESSESGD